MVHVIHGLNVAAAHMFFLISHFFMGYSTTWRIIPVSKWLITMVSKSPNWGYSPYKWPKWLINGGYYLLTKWDDPPSRGHQPH